MAQQRRKRETKGVSLLKPIPFDILKLGGKDDPCFGKLNDPKNETCQICGDFELCSISSVKQIDKLRKREESEKSFKDIAGIEDVRSFMKLLIKKGKKEKMVVLMAMSKFKISKIKAQSIYKKSK